MQTAQLLPPPAPTEGLADADIAAAIETLLVTKKDLAGQLITVQTHHVIVAHGAREVNNHLHVLNTRPCSNPNTPARHGIEA